MIEKNVVMIACLQMHTAKMTTLDLSRRQLSTRDFPFPNVTMGVHGLAVDLTSEHTTCAWLAYSDNNTYQNAIVCADDVHDTPLVCSNPGEWRYYSAGK